MREESVRTLRDWAEGVARGEPREHLWSEDAVVENAEGWVIESTYRGRDGVRRWWSELEEAFTDLRLHIEEVILLDEERVLTSNRFSGHFRATGLEFTDATWASIVTLRDGQIAKAVGYTSRNRALRAAGPEAEGLPRLSLRPPPTKET
jgi:ketosteroid isomerase-like protein